VAGVGKRYSADGPEVLTGITFDVAQGEVLAIVGRSGCGKTTLLRILCGLSAASAGTVSYDGRPVHRPPPEFAVVFQDYTRSLFPWLRVRGNVAFPLRGAARSERRARVDAALDEVGLHDVVRSYPWELSGGMQQRVAIARALVSRPHVLLLDEPFASVDALTRAELQDLLLRIHTRPEHGDTTILHVTHDIDEAVYLADRVLVMSRSPGQVVAEIDVPLLRPREQTSTRSTPEFLAIRNEIHRLIDTKEEAP
jgi:NitT/TauT family transport system ATP-binding protein